MSLSSELEMEMTSLWTLIHATASGCISISMWEIIKEVGLGAGGTWAVYVVASLGLVHIVHLHRKKVASNVGLTDNHPVEQTQGQSKTETQVQGEA